MKGEISRLHRIDAAEIWHFYAGAPLEIVLREKDRVERHLLGTDLAQRQLPQIVVPAHVWQSARTLGDFTLVGCTVAPGFEFSKFEIEKETPKKISAAKTPRAKRDLSHVKTRGPRNRVAR